MSEKEILLKNKDPNLNINQIPSGITRLFNPIFITFLPGRFECWI